MPPPPQRNCPSPATPSDLRVQGWGMTGPADLSSHHQPKPGRGTWGLWLATPAALLWPVFTVESCSASKAHPIPSAQDLPRQVQKGRGKGPGHTLASSRGICTPEQAHAPSPALPPLPGGAFQGRSPFVPGDRCPQVGAQTVKTCWRCRAQEPASRTRTPMTSPRGTPEASKVSRAGRDSREMISLPRNTGVGGPHSECRFDPPQVESVPGCEYPHWTG